MNKLGTILGNIFTYLLLGFAIILTILVISSTRGEDRIPNLFGYAIMNVETDSMESPEGFSAGDMIVIRLLDEEEANHLKVGDVITYRRYLENTMYLDTHRIVANTPDVNPEYKMYDSQIRDGVWYRGDTTYYITRGDNTPTIDFNVDTGGIEYADHNTIVGIWEGTKIHNLGTIMKFLQSQLGFMLCVVLPIALFFIYELYVFILALTKKKREEALAEVANKEEELKAAAVAEFLAKQQADNGGAKEETKPAESDPAPATEEKKPEEPKAADPAEPSEEEKARIIAEYLAKQAAEKAAEVEKKED